MDYRLLVWKVVKIFYLKLITVDLSLFLKLIRLWSCLMILRKINPYLVHPLKIRNRQVHRWKKSITSKSYNLDQKRWKQNFSLQKSVQFHTDYGIANFCVNFKASKSKFTCYLNNQPVSSLASKFFLMKNFFCFLLHRRRMLPWTLFYIYMKASCAMQYLVLHSDLMHKLNLFFRVHSPMQWKCA